eukprot:GFUD01040852.1.p1 GENE.GFUD01040852.1~~GFUD01040852.1.p1  ORF type:complete len:337 (+),score=101.80 GFUD01040852.1:51-1061(+)
MGKISVSGKTKKPDDVIGLIKPDTNHTTPVKSKDTIATPKRTQLSPTPRQPIPSTSYGPLRRCFLFSLGVFVVLVLFLSTACLVDYQQGNLAAHTSQLPRELREFPREAGQYLVGLLYEAPNDLQRVFNGAVDQVKTWTKKEDEVDSTMKVWQQIKEGGKVSIESLELVLNSEKSEEAKRIVEENRLKDRKIEEELSLVGSLSKEENMGVETDDNRKVKEEPSLAGSLSKEENIGVGTDDNELEDSLQGIADFFKNIFVDIASIFEDSKENTKSDDNDPERSPVEKHMIDTNTILRKEKFHDTESAEIASSKEKFESLLQVEEYLNHIHETEDTEE